MSSARGFEEGNVRMGLESLDDGWESSVLDSSHVNKANLLKSELFHQWSESLPCVMELSLGQVRAA